MPTNIKVIDSIMGSGKTSYVIQKMNKDKNNKYIYITPFLTEVQRIKDQCKNIKFYEPLNTGKGKLDSLHKLLSEGKNITSTHALFRMSNNITKELLHSHDYVLILDEVMDVIERLDLQKDDISTIINEKLAHMEDDFLIWDKEDYDGRYNDIKSMCLNNSIIIINNKALFWNFPVEIFKSFKEVYILTYIFDAQVQKYYYDFHNIEYDYYEVKKVNDTFELKPKNESSDHDIRNTLKDKIHITMDDKINNIGDNYYSLSSSWFKNEDNKVLWNVLKNNLVNYFNNKNKGKSDLRLWCTFKVAQNKIKGKGYTKGFIPINLRATNMYADKNVLAYCCNIFLHPDVEFFFRKRNIKVNEEKYALSEMLQWIWRSAIRNDEEITIYIPSKRMRNLFINWLDCKV
jgi:hypothetical protein